MPLSEQHRAKLDGIVQQMTANKESDETIQTVVNDFKQKYGGAESGAPMGKPQDAFEKAVNYHTGNTLIDAPLGLVQGVAKGAASTGVGIGSLFRKAAGLAPLPADTFTADTKPEGIGQGTGKFLEQAAEFAAPAGAVTKGLKGAGFVARAIGQGATAGAVSAAQSGGDPVATITGAALGAGGEAVGPALRAGKKLVGSLTERAPTLANYADSFKATPTQKAHLSAALDTLKRDGVKPTGDIHEMADAVKGKLNDLSQAYNSLDPAIKSRQLPVNDVVQKLDAAKDAYMRRGVVTDEGAYNALDKQIQTVQEIAKQNGGTVDLEDLVHLKQKANGKTNFMSPDAEHDLWRKVGNAYRESANTLAPETKALNQDYQKYSELEKIVDKNISQGKGSTPSGLDFLESKSHARHAGMAAGYAVGGAPGAIIGGMIGPKLAKGAAQILQNAIDNGTFAALPRSKQLVVKAAAKMGDNKAVLRALGQEFALQEAQ
jgi:hypothetical protein